jgi:hypothetical protein
MSYNYKEVEFNELKGKVLTSVVVNEYNDEMKFVTTDGEVYTLYHAQDCCESVEIESIVGDLSDLVGEEILMAEEAQNLFDLIKSAGEVEEDEYGSHTWTFYKLATRKGYVDIRWYGSSNGYYSEEVSFKREQ